MNNFLVYEHYTPAGELFYVGEGRPNRPYQSRRRNKEWKRIAATGFEVRVLFTGLTKEQAQDTECFLILLYKEAGIRIANVSLGPMCWDNWQVGKPCYWRGKKGSEHPMYGKPGLVGEANPMYGKPGLSGDKSYWFDKTGTKHPKHGKGLSGASNPMFGRSRKGEDIRQRSVECIETGSVYKTPVEAAKHIGIHQDAGPRYVRRACRSGQPLRGLHFRYSV